MTYIPFDPGSFLRITLPILHPRPTDAFEAALHSRDLAYAFEELHLNFIEQYHCDLETIICENCESTEYQFIRPTRTTYKVNVGKLREDHPDVHKKLVYLKSSDVEKFLGRDALYTAAVAAAGNRITKYEQVNIEDLKKYLPASEVPKYLVTGTKPLTPEIVAKNGAW